MDLDRLIKAFLYGKINKDFEYEYDDGKGGTNDSRVRVAGPPSPLDKFLRGRIENGRYVYDDGTGGQDYVSDRVQPPPTPEAKAAILESMLRNAPDQVQPYSPYDQPSAPSVDDERYVSQQVNPPDAPDAYQNSWQQFQDMNPNLDYDAVARQAGGIPGSFPVENEFGGSISEMPESAKQKEQVQALLDYVKNEIPREEIARKLDPRSRAYDPQGAEQMIQQIKQDQEAEAMAAETRIREITANAAMKNAEAYETLANQGKTAGGYQFGGGSGAPSPAAMNTRVGMLVEEMQNRMVGDGVEGGAEINNAIAADISRMKMLAGLGRYEEALVIAEKYLGNNPDNAPAPAGAAALAKKEGTSVVTPTGSKYITDVDGNMVYVG